MKTFLTAGAIALATLTAQVAVAAETIRFAVTDIDGLESLQKEMGPFKDAFEAASGLKVEFFPVSGRTVAVEAMAISTVMPDAVNSRMVSNTMSMACGDKPSEGSSSKSKRGRAINTMAISRICCSPPLRLPARVFQRARKRGKRSAMAFASSIRVCLGKRRE